MMSDDDNLARLVRVETKIDLLMQQGQPFAQDVNQRITRLERFMWLLTGFVAANGLFNAAQFFGIAVPS